MVEKNPQNIDAIRNQLIELFQVFCDLRRQSAADWSTLRGSCRQTESAEHIIDSIRDIDFSNEEAGQLLVDLSVHLDGSKPPSDWVVQLFEAIIINLPACEHRYNIWNMWIVLGQCIAVDEHCLLILDKYKRQLNLDAYSVLQILRHAAVSASDEATIVKIGQAIESECLLMNEATKNDLAGIAEIIRLLIVELYRKHSKEN